MSRTNEFLNIYFKYDKILSDFSKYSLTYSWSYMSQSETINCSSVAEVHTRDEVQF